MDKLRCDANWPVVAELAAQSPSDSSSRLAALEARVVLAEPGTVTEALVSEIPSNLEGSDVFIADCLRGHIYATSGSPERGLEALVATFSAPDHPSGYVGACIVKSRALLCQCYIATGAFQNAIESARSVEISDRTLQTNREAAIWAAVLYAEVYKVEPSGENREAYDRILHVSGIQDPRVPLLDDTLDATSPSSKNGKVRRRLSRRESKIKAKDACADTDAEATRGEPNGVTTDANGRAAGKATTNGHARTGSNTTPLQANREMQARKESECIEQEKLWLSQVALQEPLRLVVLPEDIKRTEAFKAKLEVALKDTFTSPVVMRVFCEVLVALGDYAEAFAAFKTYVTYQDLQLLKQSSGAHANPDSEAACAMLHGLMLSVIVETTTERAEKVHSLIESLLKLKSDCPETHGVLARAYSWQAQNAVGNVYRQDRMNLANHHFALCKWNMDAPTAHAWSLHLLEANSPDTFEVVKQATMEFREYLPLWHILILVLTANQQNETAETIAAQVLEDHTLDDHLLGNTSKLYLLEIKKTLVAIFEARYGITAALEQLASTIELVHMLYEDERPVHKDSKTKSSGPRKLKTDRSSLRSNHHTYRVPRAHGGCNLATRLEQPETPTPHLVDIWLWAAQMYTRARLLTDATAAIKEAEKVAGVTSASIAAAAHTQALSNPRQAWDTYSEALALDYGNMSAVIGRANLLETCPNLFESTELLEAVRDNMSALENLVNHSPGRDTAEAWYLFGTTLERMGDIIGAKRALWKSIELEEKNGLRAFVPYFEFANS